MVLERILLQTIKFDLQVDHPYQFLLKYAKCLKGTPLHIEYLSSIYFHYLKCILILQVTKLNSPRWFKWLGRLWMIGKNYLVNNINWTFLILHHSGVISIFIVRSKINGSTLISFSQMYVFYLSQFLY